MRTKLQCKQSAVGDTFPRMLVTVAFLAVVVTVLSGASTVGLRVIQSTRENLRVTQIVMQKAEALSLFDWNQVRDPKNQRSPLFVEHDNRLGADANFGRVQYAGYLSAAAPAAGGLANPAASHLRTVTVTLCSTNADGGKPVVHRREVQTRLAR